MNVELGTRFSAIRKQVIERVGDIKRGHTLQQEAEVKRIINNPNSISAKDLEAFKEKELHNLVFGVSPLVVAIGNSLTSLWPTEFRTEMNRINSLTPEQLKEKMIEGAQQKAKAWKLNLTA